jgi:hypothetical protein
MALLREEPLDPMQRDRAVKFLLATANAFAASWQVGAAAGSDVPYWGEHALTIQRYYQIACLLYGSDPAAFATVPRTTGMPAARAETCIAEYARADRVMDWFLQTYGRHSDDGPGAPTEIVYERPPTLVSTSVVRELKSIELLERVIARLHERFTLDRPLRLVMRGCGRSQAAWIPDRGELVICYELVDTLYLLGRRTSGLELDGAKTER